MKILVTGLCLSRNLGGPAMGLTLEKHLREQFPGAELTFAIDPLSFAQEQEWARRYGLSIVRRVNFLKALLLKAPLPIAAAEVPWKLIYREFTEAYASCDLVICMMGIAYVGDRARSPLHGLMCYSDYHYAKKYKKPFARFVQSFGPFDEWKVRVLARREFGALPFIPARGKRSAELCRDLVRQKGKVHDFPDIAILLEQDDSWARAFLETANFEPGSYVVVSPSNVILRMRSSAESSVGSAHVESFELIARKLLEGNEQLLLLPHMYSDRKEECDREICLDLASRLEGSGRVVVVKEDIDPMQAKALIANAKLAIVSRYHALVAAASTATPVVTIGWNIKYKDLMDYYGISEFAIDARRFSPRQLAEEVERKIELLQERDVAVTMREKHGEVKVQVNRAFAMLFDWIKQQPSATC